MELWKTIEETGGLYSVSNFGNVRRNEHYTIVKPNIQKQKETIQFYKEKVIKPYIDSTGYKVVRIRTKDGKDIVRKIHRLVALAFVDNPNGYDTVNHIDENKTNNTADNLEWCTAKYNANYGTRNARIKQKTSRKISQYTPEGKLVKVWNSMSEAAKSLGASTTTYLRRVCTNQFGRKTYKGFVWKYTEDVDKDNLIKLIIKTFSKEELQKIIDNYEEGSYNIQRTV